MEGFVTYWKSLMTLGMISISWTAIYRTELIHLLFGQRFPVCTGVGCSTGRNANVKESDARRVGCAERRLWEAGNLYETYASSVSTGVSKRESGDTLKRKDMCRDRWKDEGMTP